jgi:C4-dicarboxylate transporter DctQ subunit
MTKLYVRTLEALIVPGLCIMVGLTLLSTAVRFSGHGGIYWAEEVTRYISIWVVFLAAGLGVRFGIHLNVDLFVSYLPKRIEDPLMIICLLLMLLFEGVLIWYATQLTISNHAQQSASLRMPMSFAYAAIPVGALIMCGETLRLIVRELRGEARITLLVAD